MLSRSRWTNSQGLYSTYSSYPKNGTTQAAVSDFTPVAQLFRADGDLHLVFLVGNGVYFYEQTTDPWYRGTVPGASMILSGTNETQVIYRPEEAASPLGCVEQYQFCNADKECGPLAGKQDALAQAAPHFNMTAFDIYNNTVPGDPIGSRFYWYYLALFDMSIDLDVMLLNLGPRALVSQQSLLSGTMGPLPDNQWQLDVTYWWATRLASIQAAFVNTAYSTADAALEEYRVFPHNSYMRGMCNNQVGAISVLSPYASAVSPPPPFPTNFKNVLASPHQFPCKPTGICVC